eukprot:TRINITY_DN46725_c0_g1_i1.p1 TRINITY_DN46725_c0_g1~~TRINITY_DN46725_c0_g1_i1.p1  ORF type:complete len:124 (-),score=23.18 TRINITY_DN46725_c0_g1_i1:36-407(-)
MPTHAEVIAQNPLEAPAPFWDNVYYAGNGIATFFAVASVLFLFVRGCLEMIVRVERWEDRRAERCAKQDAEFDDDAAVAALAADGKDLMETSPAPSVTEVRDAASARERSGRAAAARSDMTHD